LKKLLGLALTIVLVVTVVSCGAKPIIYKEGTYEGNADGHIGNIKVQIVTDQYEIKDIVILSQEETPVVADIVYKKIPARVLKKNSPEVDVVAGATYTSKALIKAIKDGLSKATLK
jgi:uncharacterized protein with FMN-binding domain